MSESLDTAKKRIVAIDCDDVLVPTAQAIIEYYNQHFNTTLELKNFYSQDLTLWSAPDRETAIARVESFLKTPEYQDLEPFKEAIAAIRLLAQHYELHVVTGRSDFLTEATQTMLQKHFPNLIKSVQFTNFFGEAPRSKAQVCQDLKADVLIDDHLHHATIVAECGVDVLLYGDYSWNQAAILPPRITRVKDWAAVIEVLVPDHT